MSVIVSRGSSLHDTQLECLSRASGRDRWQASQNFAALAGVVRDAMNLPRKKIRTSLGVLSEVDNNINALTTLPWGKNASGEEQHGYARRVMERHSGELLRASCVLCVSRRGVRPEVILTATLGYKSACGDLVVDVRIYCI